MNPTNPTKPQDPSSQAPFILTRTANKAEMLKRLDHTYQMGNQVYERVGSLIDTVCDKRSAVEAFQGTDDFSTSQVDQMDQIWSNVLKALDPES